MSSATLTQAALILPLGAAVFALLAGQSPVARGIARVLMAAAAAATATAGALAALGHDVLWQGFDPDAWTGLLAAGALAGAATAMSTRSVAVAAAAAVAGGTAAGSILAPDVLYLGVLLVASTAAFAVTAYAAPAASPLRRARVLLPLGIADALALAAFVAAGDQSLAIGPFSGTAGALLLAAAALRLGLIPSVVEDALRSGTGSLLLGPVRAQGALLATVALAGSSSRGLWLLALGALGAAIAAVRLMRSPDISALLVVPAAVAACGLGLGGHVAIAGAAAALAVAFVAVVLLAGSGEPTLAAPVAAFAPVGGSLLGFGLTGGAVWRLAAARPEFIPAAVALGAAAALSAVTAWQVTERARANPRPYGLRRPGSAWAVALTAAPAVAIAGFLAFAPAFAYERAGSAVALAAGAGQALVSPPESIAEGLGIAFAALALAGLLIGGGPRGTIPTGRAASPPRWMHGWAAALPAPRERSVEASRRASAKARPWLVLTAVAGIAALGLAVRLVLVAGERGWL
ncbi:MAG TPA: hypothetical protein VM841_14670 [Actinomycetota bacterium]|nr:hypothetical protein [Actinomycetota bacterium]